MANGCDPRPLKLGVIWPVDEQGTLDYEFPRLGPWLARHGLDRISLQVENTRAERWHAVADLLETGNLDRLAPAASRLAEAGCDALVWACTSGSFIGGLDRACDQAASLSHAARKPVTSTTLALIEAARALGVDQVDVLGAYPEPITAKFVECLADAGITVAAVASLGAADGAASFALDLKAEVVEFARRHSDRRYPILIPDTAIDSLDLVEALEAIAARPVITANQATLWRGLEMLGVRRRLTGAGSLFRLAEPDLAEAEATVA